MKHKKTIQITFALGIFAVSVMAGGCASKELPVTSDPAVVTLEESSMEEMPDQETEVVVPEDSKDILVTSSMAESIHPGATAFTVMPEGASSFASAFVKPIIPAFAAL